MTTCACGTGFGNSQACPAMSLVGPKAERLGMSNVVRSAAESGPLVCALYRYVPRVRSHRLRITIGLPASVDLVLRFGLEIAGVMAFAQLFFRRPARAVD